MSSLSVASFCHSGFLAFLVLFLFHISKSSSVSLDMTELRNKVAKIKVNPRGNLWATGHFMGKKSVVDNARLPSVQEATMEALSEERLEPAELFREIRKIVLQTRLDSGEVRPKASDTAILLKILENYIQDNN